MKTTKRIAVFGFIASVCLASLAANADRLWPTHFNKDRAETAALRVTPILQNFFSVQNLQPGAPVFIRIFKQEAILELFGQAKDGQYHLLNSYPICSYQEI